MKKLLFALAAVPLLAAGCSSSSSGSVSVQTPPAVTQPAPTPPTPQTPPPDNGQAPVLTASSTVQVNSPEDALKALDQSAADEQVKVSAGDDSDLTASDSAAVNGLYGVTNGY